MRKKMIAIAVTATAVLAGFGVAAGPAQAAGNYCRTWAPVVRSDSNLYGHTLNFKPPAGTVHYYRAYWGYGSNRLYSGPSYVYRARHPSVYRVTGYLRNAGGWTFPCSTWNRPSTFP